MAAPWYDSGDPGPAAAWELFHENSKRGAHDGLPQPRRARAAPAHEDLAFLSLSDPTTPLPTPGTSEGAVSLPALAAVLAAGFRPLDAADPIAAFVAVRSVETLPSCLARYDFAEHRLAVLLCGEQAPIRIRAALPAPEIVDRSAALILLVADLDGATARGGERGYRDALILAGRHLAAIEGAARSASMRVEPVSHHDREMDALLHLDGLARSVVSAVALLPDNGRSGSAS